MAVQDGKIAAKGIYEHLIGKKAATVSAASKA